jgi:anti-anti-sigma regulatory factor
MSNPATDSSELARLRRRVAELEKQLADYKVANQDETKAHLLQTLSLVEAAFEATADGILVVDQNNRIARFNQRFIELWRIPPSIVEFAAAGNDDPFLHHVVDQVADPQAFLAKVMELYAQPDAESFDTITFKDGRIFERYSGPQRIGSTIVGRVWSFRDATERLRAEQERMALQEQVIAMQAASLAELSTPLIPINDSTLVMPLIGMVDGRRVQQLLDALLNGVAQSKAASVILDITGVPIVDTQVADAFLRAAQAVNLLGAQVILTGIRPEVAQTLVGLGIDLRTLVTRSTLQDGIAYALRSASQEAKSFHH